MSKKLQQKQERREAEEARRAAMRKAHRRSNLWTTLIAGLVAILVIGLIVSQRRGEEGPSGDVGVAEAQAGCTAIEEPEEQGADHIEVGSNHPPYSSTPPTSGPHYPAPADADFFTEPLATEQVVHNLEHGQIVIWYRPDVPQGVLDELEEIQGQEPLATLAVPFEDIEEPYNLVLTAWGQAQSCERVSQSVIDEFRVAFQGKGPENVGVPTFER